MNYSYLRETTEPACEPIHLDEAKLHLRVDGTGDDTLIPQLIKAAREWAEDYQGKAYVVRTYEMAFDNSFPEVITLPYPPLMDVSSITYVNTSGTATTVTSTDYTEDKYASPPRVFEAYSKTWPTSVREIENTIKVTYVSGYAVKFTANATTNVFTAAAWTFTDNDVVRLSNSGGSDGALPASLAVGTDYYIIEATDTTFQLALTEGGDAIDITTAGTGTQFVGVIPSKAIAAMKLLIGHWYEHREEYIDTGFGGSGVARVPLAAKALLMQDRVSW